MVVGFNHNIMYKGEMFHIQTEDSGIANPHIITLLYRGGTIIASKKTCYDDILKVENLEQVVEELMKEQHKDMLRRLKAGEFDERVGTTRPVLAGTSVATVKPPVANTATVKPPVTAPAAQVTERKPSSEPPKTQHSLDEIILDYLVSGDDK